MRLLLLHPTVAHRSCDDCQQWSYNDAPGKFGKRNERLGKPIPRRNKPPCHYCPKIPKEDPPLPASPASAVTLSDKNLAAYFHYLECRATSDFPRDAIVRRNAMLIRMVEDDVARLDTYRDHLRALMNTLGKKP